MVHVNNHLVEAHHIRSLVCSPSHLDANSVSSFVKSEHDLKTCVSNHEPKFISLAKSKKDGLQLSNKKVVAADLNKGFSVMLEGQQYLCTVRSCHCHVLIANDNSAVRYPPCKQYRSTLTSMCYRTDIKQPNTGTTHKSTTNYRYV
jgi:hypothetical protein